MQLRIAPTRLVSEVQLEFNKEFPFLKLEFFKNSVQQQTENIKSQIIPHNYRIGDRRTAFKDGVIEINGSMKVKDLEKIFIDQFRLNAQVFRRSGNVWLQTTMTDDWTLQNQNEHGLEISRKFKILFINEADKCAAAYD